MAGTKRASPTGPDAAGGLRGRLPFLLAGLVVGAMALVLTVSGGQVSDTTFVFGANSFALTFAVIALALFAAMRLPRVHARVVGGASATIIGATGLLVVYHGQVTSGLPFATVLWLPLVAVALLCAVAAWRA
ncbi:hypothetical protein [Erythrobacter mangrovi]|uniref:Uncharacterized protein n=1 Tax=Erythrobacter mangrovi TaxID=2739433 RepID=A0A7D4B8U3_9SPHN|nr:hypothetical protein [Erythrobacter mangrovi]QKG70521.1 hypothetical protein HQR01_03590 [Erythrobacter mangrovi]